MVINRKPIVAFAAAAVVSATLAACGGGDSGGGSSTKEAEKGGTLYYLTKRSAEHMDPQRIYVGRDLSNLNRIVYRGLVTVPQSPTTPPRPTRSFRTSPPISAPRRTTRRRGSSRSATASSGRTARTSPARTSSTASRGRSPPTSSPVARTTSWATSTSPRTPDGLPIYNGPYKGDNQDAYDKAVTCDGNKLTLHFSKPWPDFNYSAAFLRGSDPYREDKDQGDKSNYQIFSNGPYKLEGKWDATQGGTFVRNPEYDPASDESGTRQANPDKIVYTQGLEDEIIYDRLIADSGDDQYAITDRRGPAGVLHPDHRPGRRTLHAGRPAVRRLRAAELQQDEEPQGAPGADAVHQRAGLHHRTGRRQGRQACEVDDSPEPDRLPGQPELHRPSGG